jgi:hypothetical protein
VKGANFRARVSERRPLSGLRTVSGGHFLALYVSEGHFLGLRFVRGGHFKGSGMRE